MRFKKNMVIILLSFLSIGSVLAQDINSKKVIKKMTLREKATLVIGRLWELAPDFKGKYLITCAPSSREKGQSKSIRIPKTIMLEKTSIALLPQYKLKLLKPTE